jgi:DNA-binding NtrC family response regulator
MPPATILVIDDLEGIREALAEVLRLQGYDPGSRGSGRVRRFFDQARLQSISSQ